MSNLTSVNIASMGYDSAKETVNFNVSAQFDGKFATMFGAVNLPTMGDQTESVIRKASQIRTAEFLEAIASHLRSL